ncbi:MAG: hypothetical protein ABR569_11725 [Gaiellaceae bacterium]
MSALAFVEELQQRDDEAAAALAAVEELQGRALRIRDRADVLQSFAAALPAERERRSHGVALAETRLGSARAALARAEAELARSQEHGGERERAVAGRAAAEAHENARLAEGELARARAGAAELELEVRAAGAAADVLDADAAEAARQLSALPRLSRQAVDPPAQGPAGVADWGARARAGLFLVRAGLAAERETIIREANELGSSVLGEALGATSVAGVRKRLASAVADD